MPNAIEKYNAARLAKYEKSINSQKLERTDAFDKFFEGNLSGEGLLKVTRTKASDEKSDSFMQVLDGIKDTAKQNGIAKIKTVINNLLDPKNLLVAKEKFNNQQDKILEDLANSNNNGPVRPGFNKLDVHKYFETIREEALQA